jgi:hypothetical protein
MLKIFNAETMRKGLVGQVRHVRVYNGSARANLMGNPAALADEAIIIKGEKWQGSEGRERLLNERRELAEKLKNAATGYDAATIAALVANYVIDLQRLTDEMTDYTPQLLAVKQDDAAPESVKLRNYLPYVGKEDIVMGASDTVPLMDHNLPVDVTMSLAIKAFGDKTTFRELVFNPFHTTENIMQSAARILVDSQNKDSIGAIVGATYDAAHSQAADGSGATVDIQTYNTVKAAIKKALRLYNAPTGKRMGEMAHEIYLLVNPMDLPDVQPVIEGGLERLAGINQMVGRLPINGVIPYGGGLNDGLKWGQETLSYPGVAEGAFYVYIKNPVYGGYKVVKRAPSMEMGEGDVLALTTEKRAWHRIDGVFLDWILPSDSGGKNYGAVVKGTFPA